MEQKAAEVNDKAGETVEAAKDAAQTVADDAKAVGMLFN